VDTNVFYEDTSSKNNIDTNVFYDDTYSKNNVDTNVFYEDTSSKNNIDTNVFYEDIYSKLDTNVFSEEVSSENNVEAVLLFNTDCEIEFVERIREIITREFQSMTEETSVIDRQQRPINKFSKLKNLKPFSGKFNKIGY